MSRACVAGGPECAVDVSELLVRCLGRADIAERVLNKFRESAPADVAEIQRAFARQDWQQIALIAHRLKGAALAVAAHPLCDQACNLETAARQQEFDRIEAGIASLNNTMAQVIRVTLQNPTAQAQV